jgi:VWFA-related protein
MSRRALSVCLIVLSIATASGQQARRPEPPAEPQTPTFRLQVEYVEVDARVTDSNGHFVRDLTKEDFQIFEDGKPQTVAAFSFVDLPIEPPTQAGSLAVSIAPDVQSNERRFDGRVFVMILDDLSTAWDRTARTKNAARRFIEQHLGANDLMAVVFTGLSEPAQEFTSNKRLLVSAVDKFAGQEIPENPLPQPIGPAIGGVSAPVFTAAGGMESSLDGKRVVSTISKVAGWLDGITGRKKAVIFVSDGFTYDSRSLAVEFRPSGLIGRTNVNIYAVDMREPGTFQTATDQLTMLTANSGGFAVMDSNDIGRGLDRIIAENSTYYLLAYYPSHPRDGKYHPIDVRVKRRGVSVRSRRGYTASDGNPPAPRIATGSQASRAIVEALNSPIQRSELRMRVFAAPFRADASRASVVIGIELVGRDLPLESNGTVEISYVAVDSKGAEHESRTDRLSLSAEPATRTRVEQSGVRVLKRIDLPPGRYRLHVAAHETVRDRSGSLIYDLEVPDLEEPSVALSGVILLSRSGAAMMTAHVDERIKDMLPGPPTALRTFLQDDELAAFAEVYDEGGTRPQPVDIVTIVRSDAGAVVFEKAEESPSSDAQGVPGAARRQTVRIPLANLEPGHYILSVEARSKLNGDLAAARHVPFTVMPVETAR